MNSISPEQQMTDDVFEVGAVQYYYYYDYYQTEL